MKQLVNAILAAGLVLSAGTFNLPAGEPPASQPMPAASPAKAKYRPFRGTIKSIDKATQTITLVGAKAQQYRVTPDTKITKNGEKASLSDLVSGDKLGGRARASDTGAWEAVTINVGSKPVKEAPTKPQEG